MPHLIKRSLYGLVFTAVLILLAVWQLLPFLANKALQDYFARHDAIFSANQFGFNPFTGVISATGIEVVADSKQFLGLQHLEAHVSLLPLLQRRLQLRALQIDGLVLQSSQDDRGWLIGNIPLKNYLTWLSSEASADPADSDNVGEGAEETKNWALSFAFITLQNARINLSGATTDVWLVDTLQVNELKVDQKKWTLDVSTRGSLNNSKFALQTRFQGLPQDFTQWLEVEQLHGDLQSFASFLPAELHDSKADFDYNGELLISSNAEGMAVSSTRGSLVLRNADLRYPAAVLQGALLDITIGQFSHTRSSDAHSLTEARANVSGLELSLWDPPQLYTIVGVSRLDATRLTVSSHADGLSLASDVIQLDGLLVSDKSGIQAGLSPLLLADSMELKNMQYAEQKLQADRLALTNPTGYLNFSAAGTLLNAVTDSDLEQLQLLNFSGPQHFAVHQIELRGEGKLLLDRAASDQEDPLAFQVQQFIAEGLDSARPDQALHVQLTANTQAIGELSLDTRVWPFKETLEMDARGWLNDYNTQALAALLKDPLGQITVGASRTQAKFVLSLYGQELSGEWQMGFAEDKPSGNRSTIHTLRKSLSNPATVWSELAQWLSARNSN
jgi:hypothetical protein